jgi:hypothetical protein
MTPSGEVEDDAFNRSWRLHLQENLEMTHSGEVGDDAFKKSLR